MKCTLFAALLTTGVVSNVGANAGERLDDTGIGQFISDKRVVLNTKYGKFPMRYASDNQVTGDGSGTGLGRFFNAKETGNWWVKDGQLCQKFPTWYDGKTFCFVLEKTGPDSLRWIRNDGYSGTASVSG